MVDLHRTRVDVVRSDDLSGGKLVLAKQQTYQRVGFLYLYLRFAAKSVQVRKNEYIAFQFQEALFPDRNGNDDRYAITLRNAGTSC